MKRYTAKDIENAADACAIKASSPDATMRDALEVTGGSYRADQLAWDANHEAIDLCPLVGTIREDWALAEALLRTGWLPGGSARAKAKGKVRR